MRRRVVGPWMRSEPRASEGSLGEARSSRTWSGGVDVGVCLWLGRAVGGAVLLGAQLVACASAPAKSPGAGSSPAATPPARTEAPPAAPQGSSDPSAPTDTTSEGHPAGSVVDRSVVDRSVVDTPPETVDTPPETGREAPAASPPLPPPAPPSLPEGTTVLHVGDSFADALGRPLKRLLEERGLRAVLAAETASYIPGWSSYGKIERLLARHDPDLVLITLGANELEIGDPAQRVRNIRRIVSIVEGRPCVWIAIPLWAGPKNGLMDIIRDNVEPCVFMDTNALIESMPRIRDGIHPTQAAREDWAGVVVRWLETRRRPTPARPWNLLQGEDTGEDTGQADE